jgi:invasion protein IalB
MTIRIVSALARPVRTALVTSVAVLLAVSAAHAQAPAPAAPKAAPPPAAKKPAAPRPPAAPPAQAQQPPPGAQPGQPQAGLPTAEIPQLVYSPWTKLCGPPPNAPKDNNKLVCFTGKDARTESGMPVVVAALIEIEGEQAKSLRVTLPFGLAVAVGTRIIIDQNPPLQAPFLTCAGLNPNMGCFSQYEATPDLVTKLKRGQLLTIQAVTLNQQVVNYPLSLADFAKANEGPATDPQQLEAQQKKQQEELQKKADELRKKLEEQKGIAAPK